MTRQASTIPMSSAVVRASNILTFVLIAAILYVTKEIFIPLALAILFSFLLAPLVQKLERRGLPRVPAVVLVAGTLFLLLGMIGWIMVTQVIDLYNTLPAYEQNIEEKTSTLQGMETVLFTELEEGIGQIRDLTANVPGETTSAPDILPVQVVEPAPTPLAMISQWLNRLSGPLGMIGLVVVLTLFMLLRWSNLRERVLRLTGQGQLSVTTRAFDDASRRVSRYLLAQFSINVATGLIVAIGLMVIGVPNAPLWGLLSIVLRYIPFVGPLIAALFPVVMSILALPGWGQPLLTVALFVTIEMISNTFIEPWAYGSSTGVSPIGILVSALIWAWMWGPIGLLLATPMTVCLVVMGRYVPQLSIFHVMLGDDPVISDEARLYQRLLALDVADAMETIETFSRGRTTAGLYDLLLLPTLSMAERDRHTGKLEDQREECIYQTLTNAVIETRREAPTILKEPTVTGELQLSHHKGGILCLPAHDKADTLVCLMLQELLAEADRTSLVIDDTVLVNEMVDLVGVYEAQLVVVSAVPPNTAHFALPLTKALHAHYPSLKIIVGLWDEPSRKATNVLLNAGAYRVVNRLEDAVTAVKQADPPQSGPDEFAQSILESLKSFDTSVAESLIDQVVAAYGLERLFCEAIQPTLYRIGEEWSEGTMTVEQEHFASDFFRTRLAKLSAHLPPTKPDAPRAIAACAPDEQHEIGLFLLTLLLRQKGWNVIYLGQRVPGDGIPALIATSQPRVVLFSASRKEAAAGLIDTVKRVHATLDDPPAFVFGGQGFTDESWLDTEIPGTVLRGDAPDAVRYIVEAFPTRENSRRVQAKRAPAPIQASAGYPGS